MNQRTHHSQNYRYRQMSTNGEGRYRAVSVIQSGMGASLWLVRSCYSLCRHLSNLHPDSVKQPVPYTESHIRFYLPLSPNFQSFWSPLKLSLFFRSPTSVSICHCWTCPVWYFFSWCWTFSPSLSHSLTIRKRQKWSDSTTVCFSFGWGESTTSRSWARIW